MTLTIHTEEDEQRQLAVTIEVAESRVQDAMRRTVRKLARDVHVPGFRRGKAPYNVMLRRFGKEAIRAEAIEELIQPVFEEALDEVAVEPYAQATFEDMQMEPLVLKFTIPLQPTIKLGDYRSLRKEVEAATVTDEALEDALKRVRVRHQVLEEVDRPVEAGDLVSLSGSGELVAEEVVEDETAVDETAVDETEADPQEALEELVNRIIFNEENIDFVMDSSETFPNTPFVDNIIGMAAGEEKTFRFTFPADYEDEELAGKEAEFEIAILNVQRRELPELTDELAKEEGPFETVDELRDALRERLQEQAEAEAKNELIEGMIDDLLKDAEIVYPPAAVEQEIDDMVANFKNQAKRSGWDWEDFLKLQGNSEDDIRENFRETAVERVQRQLILRQFVLDEKLSVTAEDIDSYVEDRVKMFGDNEELQESMRNYYRSGYGFDMISSEVLMDKAYQRIQAILAGSAPDLDSLEDEAEVSDDFADEEE